jgi:rRNA maturation endonuclease Nob1
MSCDQVLIFDTSSLINSKAKVRPSDQWWFFDALLARLRDGRIVVPFHTQKELQREYPDMPGAWAASTYKEGRHPYDPDDDWVVKVMERVPDVIEIDSPMDKADPYVLALALQLREAGFDVVVVTDDYVDRPSKMSLVSACRAFKVDSIDFDKALDWLGDHPPDLGPLPAFL